LSNDRSRDSRRYRFEVIVVCEVKMIVKRGKIGCIRSFTAQVSWRTVMECYWVLGQRLDSLATGETTRGGDSLFHYAMDLFN
jgi:hypothetical protein